MVGGFAATQLLVTAARLSIADHVAAGHTEVEALAAQTGAAPGPLGRFLRMLVVLGVLRQSGAGRFELTPMGQFLRADHPDTQHERLIFIGAVNYPTAQASVHAVKTGEKAFDQVFGMPLFDYLDGEPQLRDIFAGLMSDSVEGRAEGICRVHDFADASLIVDVGGGDGSLLRAILRTAPQARGVVFDRQSLASGQDGAPADAAAREPEFVGGDMFAAIAPAGADIYILSNIIHDWNDEESIAILRNCRAAMKKDSRLLIIEEILPTRIEQAPATIANDYSMLLLTGGRQRTRQEFAQLLKAAGLRLSTVRPIELNARGARRRENWALVECRPGR
ncbi:methyltransferase [Ancylobacter amanitiformis]|uniref:Methyltransferase n=1 Tax=Ancylobacter amanitiformis TaxID=217069 RepID=A0ABU0LU11_9HYPH|nr:methyltransferase [Ancylobacter amanitiformis]MDQ0512165.1 hypothetical protein [Ancylobacter amanitiformis]